MLNMLLENIIKSIGNTPLVKLPLNNKSNIYAKLEYLNPSGSVKDRSALFMIEQAEKKGLLKPGGTIIEASSGNQGIATAMIGAAKGYNVIITVFEKASNEKVQAIQAYGAKIIKCPSTKFISDPESYHSQAVALAKQIPNSYMLNQYYNVENAHGHHNSLGKEIWEQTNGKITHFFAAAGSGGTISGVGRYLKEKNKKVKIIAIDSENSFRSTNGNPKPYKLEGIGVDFNSEVLNYSVIDEFLTISDENAFNFLKILALKFGILAGPTSGAVSYIVNNYQLNDNDLAVMIFGDSGRAYLSKGYYNYASEQNVNFKVSNANLKIEQPEL